MPNDAGFKELQQISKHRRWGLIKQMPFNSLFEGNNICVVDLWEKPHSVRSNYFFVVIEYKAVFHTHLILQHVAY